MRIDSPVMTNAIITGSFSGSFVGSGNFEGLEADSVEFANVLNKPTLLSGSAQIASDISGSFTSVSSSLAADIATNTAAIANLDGSYATDAELNASSSALITAYENADTTLSASLATDIAANTAKVGYTDTLVKTKLNTETVVSGSATDVRSFLNVEDGADVTDSTNVQAAGALMDSEVTNLADVKAFDPADYATAAQGTKADNALPEADVDADIKTLSLPANTTISSFGASLVDDADASAARTTLGVDASGTDNSTDVTLVTTSHDYLSISGQAITLGTVDISDDTNLVGGDGIDLTGDTLSTDSTVARTNADNTFTGTQTFNNIAVNGTGSFALIQSVTGSAKIIGDAYIVLNNDTPAERYAGIAVYDSGSAGVTSSLEFDGQTNDWFYEYSDDGGATTEHGAVLFGPEYNTKGSPTYPTSNTIQKGNGGHHLLDSNITDNGSTITLGSNTTVSGNITVTGTVDGRDVAADGTKLDGIAANANNYTHPTHDGDDIDIDTGALTGATVISDLDFNVTTDGLGHVTDANATVATRTLTAGNLGLGSGDDVTFGSVRVDDATASTSKTTGALIVDGGAGIGGDLNVGGDTTTEGGLTVGMARNARAYGANFGNLMISDGYGIYDSTDDETMRGIVRATAGDGLFLRGTTGASFNTYGLKLKGNTTVLEGNFGSGVIGSIWETTGFMPAFQIGDSTNYALGNKVSTTIYSTLNVKDDVVAYHSSDERFKDNIVEIDNSLDKVEALRGVYFDWNDKQDIYEGHDIGVIAQEVEAVLPEIVETRVDGYKAVKYEKLTAVLIQAVKELSARVKELENK
jgi:hypothetical protein